MPTTSVQTTTTVEHVLLFKVKDNVDVNAMLSTFKSLSSIDSVHYFTVGPIHRNKSSPFPFTHFCHARYSSQEEFAAYLAHPLHVSIVKDFFYRIRDVSVTLDWVANGLYPTPRPGAAVRVSFLKVKESLGEEVKEEILEAINGIKESVVAGVDQQFSCGENLTPATAKGYSIASLAVFPGLAELEAVDTKDEVVNGKLDKVKDYLDSSIVVDFLVPSPQSPPPMFDNN